MLVGLVPANSANLLWFVPVGAGCVVCAGLMFAPLCMLRDRMDLSAAADAGGIFVSMAPGKTDRRAGSKN